MLNVLVEGAHRAGKKRKDGQCPKIHVCTIMDTHKRQILLHNSSTYLKSTSVYINEDLTFMQQEEVRKRVAALKAKIEKKNFNKKWTLPTTLHRGAWPMGLVGVCISCIGTTKDFLGTKE